MAEISETLKVIAVRNQVLLERLKQGEHEKFEPFLKRLEKSVRIRLSDEGETIATKKRLNALLVDVKSLQKAIYDDYLQQLTLDLGDIAIAQSEFEGESYNKVVKGFESTIPSAEQVLAAVRVNPLQVEGYTGNPLLEQFIKDWSSARIQQVSTIIQQGFYQGQTNAQITVNLRGTKANKYNDGQWAKINRANKSLVRTAVQHSSTQARQETMKQNSDLIKGYEWVSTLDSHTSPQCQPLDGRVFKIGEGPLSPLHPNCVLGNTIVSTCSSVSKLFKRRYEGIIIEVVTKSGRHLSITPNHPVLTLRGWVNAGELNGFDKVVAVGKWRMISDNHKDSVKAKFSNIFSSANVSADPLFISNRPVAAEHFHGDGVADTDVDIIDINSLAWDDVVARLGDKFSDDGFILGKWIKRSFNRFSSLGLTGMPNNASFSHDVSGSSKRSPFFWRKSRHARGLLLTSISKFSVNGLKESIYRGARAFKSNVIGYSIYAYARFVSIKNKLFFSIGENDNRIIDCFDAASLEHSGYGLISDTESLAYFLHRDMINSVEIDDISYIGTREFNGHVYNLENKEHWYTSNDIITHNCRSSTTPVLSERYDFLKTGAKRAVRGADGGGQVSANETYYSWLKGQPKAFQTDAIGPKRAKLLRDGGLTSDEFARLSLNRNFEPLTLDEMKKKAPSAFEMAGM